MKIDSDLLLWFYLLTTRRMEKLVKLLNEAHRSWAMLFWFCTWRFEWKFCAEDQWSLTVDDLCWHDDIYYFSNRDICWKDGWFIERLVKNNKINFKTFGNAFWTKYLEYPIWSHNYDKVSDYKDILQWLAISDTPIEDLCYYLK